MSLFWDRALATLGIVRGGPPASKPGDVQVVRDDEDGVYRPYVVNASKQWERLQAKGHYPPLASEAGNIVDASFPWGHVRRYGALGDGTTDDFTAFNRAIDADVGFILLDKGTFRVSQTIAIPLNFAIVGVGYTSIIDYRGAGPCIQYVCTDYDANLLLSRFKIISTSGTPTYAIEIENGYHTTLESVMVQGAGRFSQAALHLKSTLGVGGENTAVVRAFGCQFLQTGGNGVLFTGAGGVAATWFYGCRIQGNDGRGVLYEGGPAAVEVHFLGCDIEGNTNGQVRLSWTTSSSIEHCHIEAGASTVTPLVFGNDSGIQRNLRICNNTISSDGAVQAVNIDIVSAGASVGVTIEDNSFANAQIADIQFGAILGLRVRNNQASTGKPLLKKGSGWAGAQNIHLIDPQRGEWFFGAADGANQRSAPRFTRGLSIGQNAASPYAVGNVITRHISATKTWDPGSCAAGAVVSTTVTVAGCVLGDTCLTPAFSLALGGLVWLGAEVSAADTVTVYLYNPTGGAIDIGSGTLRAGYLSYTDAADDALPVDTNILVS